MILTLLLILPASAANCPMLVATRDIPPAHAVTEQDVAVAYAPCTAIHQDVLRDEDQVVGRRPAERILAGEPIRQQRVDGALSITSMIPTGMRALSMPVDPVVSSSTSRGEYVDLFRSGEDATCLIGEAFYVLYTVPLAGTPAKELLVAGTTSQVASVAWTLSHGTLEVVLRNAVDHEPSELEVPKCTTP